MALQSEEKRKLFDALRDVLERGNEARNLECKERIDWHTASDDEKCEIVKDILAMANTQGGGWIIFGVRNEPFELVGLTEDEFNSLDNTAVNDFVAIYTDPPHRVDVQRAEYETKPVAGIFVPEFEDLPVICAKERHSSTDQRKLILRKSAIYVRTDKANSEEVSSSAQLRALLELAISKRQGATSDPYQSQIEAAIKFFNEEIPRERSNIGYVDFVARPTHFDRSRIDASSIEQVIGNAELVNSSSSTSFPCSGRYGIDLAQSGPFSEAGGGLQGYST